MRERPDVASIDAPFDADLIINNGPASSNDSGAVWSKDAIEPVVEGWGVSRNMEPAGVLRQPSAASEGRSEVSQEAPVPLAARHQRGAPRDLRKTGLSPDFCYPLARSEQVVNGKPLGVSFAGQPIVLVRPTEGTVFALENRCAHRQIPLESGVVHGALLQCAYHGWTYDSTGACVNVPYLEKAKALPNGVRSCPCREAYGLIFDYPGDLAKHAFPR